MGRPYSDDLRERVVRAVSKAACRGTRRRPNLDGDQLGTALPRERQRQAGPDRRLSAKEDCRGAPRMADATVQEGFYRARAGGRARRAWPQGRLPHDVGVRPR